MSKVLILGGAGWVGHNVANGLNAGGCEVTVIHLSMDEKFVPALDRNIKHILGNTGDEAVLRNALAEVNPDVVIDIHPQPQYVGRNCDLLKGQIKHYLHCSSAGVYVPTGKKPVDENAVTHPKEEYGQAFIDKKKSDEIAMSHHDSENFPVTIVRPGIILGAGFTPLELWGFRNPEFFKMVRDGKTVLLADKTDTMMSIVHVKDVANVFVQAVLNPAKSKGEIFNAVSWDSLTHADYLKTIGDLFGVTPRVEYVDMEELIRRRSGQPMFYEADYRFFMADLAVSGNKAKEKLGVKINNTLEEVLEESLQDML